MNGSIGHQRRILSPNTSVISLDRVIGWAGHHIEKQIIDRVAQSLELGALVSQPLLARLMH